MTQSTFNFDITYDRAAFSSAKWVKYGNRDILPFWVADMDFAAPDFILEAIRERLEHPTIGYTELPEALVATFIDWADRSFGWHVHPDWIVAFTSLVPGLNTAVRSVGDDNDASLIMTPIYPPFLMTSAANRRQQIRSELVLENGQWVMDFDDLNQKAEAANVKTMLLSNPQNPTGRIYTREELQQLGEIGLRTNTVVVSDEIHWGLCLEPSSQHMPIAALNDEIEQNTITLISHTKSYNVSGLQSAFAVIRDPVLRQQFFDASPGWMSTVSPLSYAAATAAYADRSSWLADLQAYLRINRDMLGTVVDKLPNVAMAHVEGTHLGWMDARAIPVQDHAAYFEAHGLGLSDGVEFGSPGFVRFNFATPRTLLEKGLARLESAAKCAPHRK